MAKRRTILSTSCGSPWKQKLWLWPPRGQPQLAAQIYAASLLAIEVDTLEERDYLNKLAADMGLSPQVTGRIHENGRSSTGIKPAGEKRKHRHAFPRKPFCLQFFINKSKVCNDLRGSGPSCGSLSFDRYYRLNFLRKEINTGMKKMIKKIYFKDGYLC